MEGDKEKTDEVTEETGLGDPLADSEPIEQPDPPETPDIEPEDGAPEQEPS
jgi:hypothetical protein